MDFFKVFLVMAIIVGTDASSTEIYVSTDNDNKDIYGVQQIYDNNVYACVDYTFDDEASASTSNRFKLSNDKDKGVVFDKDLSPLGLKLDKSPSFIKSVELKLYESRKKIAQDQHDKLKASNFSARLLEIGSWKRFCRHEGDLIAKCYYAKKKIVWEILEGALKRKIEIQWSDIIGINAIIRDDEPGILEIELNNPPAYFLETNPQPRKHTLWQTASDFTEGQAPSNRRHKIVFPPGILDKHYEKLLQCDQRLFELSQKPFPTLNNPYFNSNNFYALPEHSSNVSRNVNRYVEKFHPQMQQYHAQKFHTQFGQLHRFQDIDLRTNRYPSCHFVDSTSPVVTPQLQYHVQNYQEPFNFSRNMQNLQMTSHPHFGNVELASSMSDETATNYANENQRAIILGHETNNIQVSPFNYANENQRAIILGQERNNIQVAPSMNYMSSQVNMNLYQGFDVEGSGLGSTPTNSTGISIAEDADTQILLDDMNLLMEQNANFNTNNIYRNDLMSESDLAIHQAVDQYSNHAGDQYSTHVGLNHVVDQYCEGNDSMVMAQLSRLPHQDSNATMTMIPARNSESNSYLWLV